MIGTQIGQFRITAKIGQGGMGEVYRADDLKLDRSVAIKVLPKEFAADPERLERFSREAKAVAALSHPNILSLYDLGEEDGVLFAVMELLEGETLRARLDERPIPLRKALDYGAQIARGLAAAHEKGVVHRDLKPENVFLTQTGQVKILDFGLAKIELATDGETLAYGEGTAPGTVLGTVGYMSPEQVRGVEVDARSDLFSFGCVLYEMVSGQPPFRGDSPVETMSAILKEDPPELESSDRVISPGIDRLVRHCLEKQPAERFQSARDLAFDLEALRQSSSASGIAPAGSRLRTKPRLGARLAVGLAAVLGLLGAYWLSLRTAPSGGLAVKQIRQLTFEPQAIFNARYGPDGETLAFTSSRTGSRPRIFRLRAGEHDPEDLGLDETHLLAISSQGEMAVLTGARYQFHRVFRGTLARLPLTGGAPKELLEEVIEADWSPGGEGLAVVRLVDGVYRLEYPVGTVLVTLESYATDLRFAPDGKTLAFLNHPLGRDNRGSVWTVDLDGSVRAVTETYSATEGLVWAPDGESILFTASLGTDLGYGVLEVDRGGEVTELYPAMGELRILDVGAGGRWLTLRETIRPEVVAKGPGTDRARELGRRGWPSGSLIFDDGKRLLFSDQSSAAGEGYEVCLQGTDGSAIMELGPGFPLDVSPDESWILAIAITDPPALWLYPTGPGEARRIGPDGLLNVRGAHFLEDGRSLLVCGQIASTTSRCYQLDLETLELTPRTPEATEDGLPSPDGSLVAAGTTDGWAIFGPEGDEGRPIPGAKAEDQLVRWSPDGSRVWFARASDDARLEIEAVDPNTGERSPLGEIAPADRRGIVALDWLSLADDPEQYAYTARRRQSALFEITLR